MGVHPRLIDAHSHFDDASFDADREQALTRARDAGIVEQIIPAVKAAWWPRIKQLCKENGGLHPSYGLHPMYLGDHREEDLQALRKWVTDEHPIAIGECGLDFYIDDQRPEQQQHYFEGQLRIAVDHELPVIIHARQIGRAHV